jgi:capsular polysaccharide biosynthesis protein
MTIQEYLRILQRRGWIVVVAVLLAAAGAFGVSYLQEDMYRATVYVSTVPARPDWGLGNTAKDLMRNFAANLQTPEIAQTVINRAQLDMNPYDFLGLVNVVAESSDFTIKIEARSRDPQVAQTMALTLADQFVEERTAYYAQQDLDNRIEVKIRSRAIGYDHYQPKPLVNAIAGSALGLLLGLGLLLMLTWIEADLLRTPAALERALGVPVLGAIPVVGSVREVTQPLPAPNAVPAAKSV